MKICMDLISECELGSDSIPCEEVDDMFVRFKCKMVDRSDAEVEVDIGANPSAEDEEQETTQAPVAQVEQVLDVVKYHALEPTQFTKKTFKLYLKEYIAQLFPKLTDERRNFLKQNMEKCMASLVIDHFNECEFYIGKEFNGAVGICREIDNVKYLYYMKDGVYWEKF